MIDSKQADNAQVGSTIDASTVRVDLLGSVSVVADGIRTELRAGKIRSMLATLALDAGRIVYYDELVQELWPGESLKNPRNALQAHATRIRRTFERSILQTDQCCALRAVYNGYILDIPHELVDSNRFLDLTARGATALSHDPAEAARLLRQGLDLWRGPALLNTHTGERCRGAAAFLEERRLLAWEDLTSAHLLLGDNRQAATELRRLVATHPTRERLCALLMLALYRTDRQSDALRLFHCTRKHLDEELGVEPGKALLRLYEDILTQHPALDCPEVVLKGSQFGIARH
ncbi:AfsR/SARP family transcriptional regulator [Nocardia altamirensis]|uniref:AfsR/SARP family transcriptional regulator n=1 Tax=Nocardia altamirensis TaxID=472158 RepID=UPI001C3FEF77|nr:BTAD domain-containing putative transcriptional regulator [Nocardia altamirensis]